ARRDAVPRAGAPGRLRARRFGVQRVVCDGRRGSWARALAGSASAWTRARRMARTAREAVRIHLAAIEDAQQAARAVRIGAAGRREAHPQAVRIRRAETGVRAAQETEMEPLFRLRPLVRPHPEQRTPRLSCNVLRLRSGIAARAERGGRRSAALLRRSEAARAHGERCAHPGRVRSGQPTGNTSRERPRWIVIANELTFFNAARS